MDNVTHTLTGLALSRAGLNKHVPRATFLLIVAANIPDIDMITLFEGRLRNLEIHRGYSHALIGLPFMAVISVLLTALVFRSRLPWFTAWLVSCVGVASHLLLDWSMTYGVRLLLPFSSSWYYLDIFNLIDWVVVAVLLFCWLAPMLGNLVSSEIGSKRAAGRGFAIFALVFILIYGGFRALMHNRALAQLNSRLYDSADGALLRTAALPGSFDPVSWTGIVETEHAYRIYTVPAFGNFDPASTPPLYKAPWSPALEAAAKTRLFRYFLYFARFPYWQEENAPATQDLKIITVTDLRFGLPDHSFFEIKALVDAQNRVQGVSFGTPTFTRAE